MRDHRWTIGAGVAVTALAAGGVLTWGGPAVETAGEPPPAADSAAAAAPAAARGKGGAVWGASYFPNVPLVTHDGRTVRFFDDLIAGRVVAINFIYTTCPDACPMETARMMEVHRLLGDRVGRDVFFYSITIDPERDTPEVLREYVADWGVGAGWTFLTGREEDVTLLRRKLGVYSARDPGETPKDHNLSLVIGNQATGRWMKRSPYENPYVLANQLGSWLHEWKLPGEGGRDFADAPEIRQISTGENLFRTRCASCHTIGGGDVVAPAERRIGPDLYHVGRQRDRAWLVRWLKEPDLMLAEGDPLATALLAQYQGIPMPNLRLTDVDAEKLLAYIDEESRRLEEVRVAEAAHGHERHLGDDGGRAAHAGREAHGAHPPARRGTPGSR